MKMLKRNPWPGITVVLLLLFTTGCDRQAGPLQIGDRAPGFTVVDLQGNHHSLEEWKGHPVILRFWETDCKYCRADTPVFNTYYTTYRDKGLKVVYISTGDESAETVRAFARELAIDFPVVLDADKTLTALYRVKVAPQTIFIAPDQTLVAAILGGVGEPELRELAGKYFKQ